MQSDKLKGKVESLYTELSSISERKFSEVANECKKHAADFSNQYDYTVKDNRLLRLAIIGQVKAGKSSFLNTFLFEGEEVLPKAATPKTANLTIIRHSENCRVEIEYYSQSDWERLKDSADLYRQAKAKYVAYQKNGSYQNGPAPLDPDMDAFSSEKAAFEMHQAVMQNGLDAHAYISKKTDTIQFADLSDMRAKLDEYVGESGKLTPITKAVWLYINDKRLMDLEIVDTPGLNDPVPARTERTREMLKTTDVAFFLSQTGGAFLDGSDVNLLVSQMPSEGINYFVLVGSKYDSALQNCLDADSLREAENDVHKYYDAHASRTLNSHLAKSDFIDASVRSKILSCLPPIYISAMLHNLAIKPEKNWDDHEKTTYGNMANLAKKWNDLSINKQALIRMGNMDKIYEKYEVVKSEKSEILENKIKALAPAASQKLQEMIKRIITKAEDNIEILQTKGVTELEQQEKQLLLQIDGVKGGVSEVIGDLITDCGKQTQETKKHLREETSELTNVIEQTGTRQETVTKTGYRTKRFLFWSWESPYSYDVETTVSYRYASVNNAIDNMRKAANRAANKIEALYDDLIEPKKLRLDLLNVIRDSFDAADDSYNPAFFKQVIQDALEQIELPSIKIDPSTYIEELANQFPEPQQIDTGVDKLNIALGNAMNLLGQHIIEILEEETNSFKSKLQAIRGDLGKNLIDRAIADLDKLKKEMKNKDAEIKDYQKCIDASEKLSMRVSKELS